MKISLITVSFNSKDTIESTIESVLGQSYEDIEYILVDSCSDDGTREIINKYRDKISKIIIEKDDGIYDAMNKGIAASTGDVVGIINSDDIFSSPLAIEKVSHSLQANTNADACLTNVIFFDGNTRNPIFKRHVSPKYFRPWQLKFGWMPPHPGIFFRRKIYLEFGNYDQDYSIAADYDFCLRVFLVNKIKFLYLDTYSVYMREGGISTKNFISNYVITKEILKACKKNGIYTNFFLILSRLPIKFFLNLLKKRHLE